MAGFEHYAHLGWIGFQLQTPPDQAVDSGWAVLDPELLDHPPVHRSQSDVVKLFRPVNTDTQHQSPLRRGQVTRRIGKALRRADEPVLQGRHPPGRQAFAGPRQGRRLISVLTGHAPQALPAGIHRAKGR